MDALQDQPGLLYVVATLLPLAAFVLLLLLGAVKCWLRQFRETEGLGGTVSRFLDSAPAARLAAYVATGAIGLAFFLSLAGFLTFLHEEHFVQEKEAELVKLKEELRKKSDQAGQAGKDPKVVLGTLPADVQKHEKDVAALKTMPGFHGHVDWARVSGSGLYDPQQGTILRVGYHIDGLAAVMFLMVTLISTLIFVFSIGYMSDELAPTVTDHQVHTEHGHLHRRGRFGRFFMYLSLFCFSMLNLILADNLFQVFVSWELVGICSYLLIGHYYERTSASNAANKAFITNRVGDAGFIVGLMIVWTYFGTFEFDQIFRQVRSPLQDTHGTLDLGGRMVRAELKEENADAGSRTFEVTDGSSGAYVLLFPRNPQMDPGVSGHFHGLAPGNWQTIFSKPRQEESKKTRDARLEGRNYAGAIPYWLLVAAGLGIFLGCVGKSAQFPLQVWLPDAMEGPTPVSALIHAATMVAAGVYLVGRCYPLFTPEVLLVIAYTGAITLFVAATIAIVMTDIKKVLAYSTVSQLGYMMLALGVGGWVAGLFHLITHAFFKALLFLGSGSVIYGCHHEQEMTKMGGLYPKMKITALTMLTGVLAIAGIPLFSGWYSKDAILANALGFVMVPSQRVHFLLFLLPLLTAGITTFYMFRMWFMTFTGKPRDVHVYEHAKESPWVMTVPLIVLAFFSVVVAWGMPPWNTHASLLEHQIHHSEHEAVVAQFGYVAFTDKEWKGPGALHRPSMSDFGNDEAKYQEALAAYQAQLARHRQELPNTPRGAAHVYHDVAGNLALGIVAIGFIFAWLVYYRRALDPHEAREQFPAAYSFLRHKWYFDEIYSALVVRPALAVAHWCRFFDNKVIDGVVDGSARATVRVSRDSGRFDLGIIDGLANLIANVSYGIGAWLRNFQTGYIRSYVLFLVLAAIGIWAILSALVGAAATPTK
jgi:NADH-quinone oxidoreductase subunit L